MKQQKIEIDAKNTYYYQNIKDRSIEHLILGRNGTKTWNFYNIITTFEFSNNGGNRKK